MNKMGFGFLRLPRLEPGDENSVDFERVCALADRFISLGGNYFDTAYTYLCGNSEAAICKAVVKRWPREKVRIANKLPTWKIKSMEGRDKYFRIQLERCGVEYFDVLMLHGLDAENYEICRRFALFEYIEELKKAGKARKTGFSFHDSPELLDRILTEQPEVDYVLLQINYLDWESLGIRARDCYETELRHGKHILVMEPVKGGSLANLPEEAEKLLQAVHPEWSMASWAVRFVQSLPGVEIVLSGMNDMQQIEDNLQDIEPLSAEERAVLAEAAEIIRRNTAVACTGCGYCVEGCPKHIPIPGCFALYNDYARKPAELWKMGHAYQNLTKDRGSAGECIGCGQCENSCPQGLEIIENLKKLAKTFEAED